MSYTTNLRNEDAFAHVVRGSKAHERFVVRVVLDLLALIRANVHGRGALRARDTSKIITNICFQASDGRTAMPSREKPEPMMVICVPPSKPPR